jgi:hypothetical protein
MKQDNEIDQFFRDASKVDLNEEIPSVFLSDLNSRLDAIEKKRKKPAAFWWLVGVLSLSLFTLGATFLYTSADDKPSITKNEIGLKSKSEKPKMASKSEVNEQKNQFQISSSYSVDNHTITKDKSSLISTKTNETLIVQSVLNTKSNTVSDFIPKDETSEKELTVSTSENSKSTSKDEVKNGETPIENEEVIVVDSVNIKDSVLTNQTNEKTDLVKEKKKLSIQKEIGFFSGVSGIISSFDIPSSSTGIVPTTIEWRETREREEVSTTSWDFAVRMKWVINSFSVQTGLDYFQWGEEIKYSYNSISGINRYSYLNVPINLGYAKTWNKFGINPFAGVMFGYGFNRTGNYLQLDLTSIAQAESKQYLANYQIGCEFYFLSESQFKFSLIPVYRASFKEVVYTDLIRNRYQSIGLQLGISYKF